MARAQLLPIAAVLLAGLVGISVRAAEKAKPAGPPVAPKRPVTDEYFGTKVVDDYRWLEDWSDPAVRRWSDGQNRHARDVLARLPGYAAIRERVKEMESGTTAQHFALRSSSGRLFGLKAQPPKQQPFLVVLSSPDEPASERVLLDPNVIDPRGGTRIDFFVPSLDGARVAVSLSEKGTESGTVRVVDVASAQTLPDRVPRVNGGTAGGSVAWNADGSGFAYTRYPREGERAPADMDFFQQVYFHRLGTPTSADAYELGKELPRIAEIVLASSDDGRTLLASVANGDGGEFEHFVKRPDGGWVQVTRLGDGVVRAGFSADDGLFLLSRKASPRGQILRVPLAAPELATATVVVAESEAVIRGFLVTRERLYVDEIVGGPSQVRIFKLGTGEPVHLLPLHPGSAVDELVRLDPDTVLYRIESYTDPPAWYRFTPGSGKAVLTGLFDTSPADFSDCEVARETAVSKDGTKVPLTIVRRKGTPLDKKNPTLLTGYGGFGISITPSFSPELRVWLEQGGVFAEANLRGGGELGEAWHEGGKTTRKQNVFDDLAACAAFLVESGITSPARLAVEGGSNGGLLMGAMITQHPELFRAVVARVGLFDMLRFERFPNGLFNVTEYGSVTDEEQLRALLAYSPYQHVVDGTAYPAVLLTTGANDPRVDPANSRKMAARLQAATSSGRPVLLRTSAATGHLGSGLDERVAEDAAAFAFLFHELGVKYVPVPRPTPAAAP